MAPHTIFYDGVCGLCDRFTQLVLRNDAHDLFRFAPLQGDYARRILGEHDIEADRLDTMFVLTSDGRLLERSDAALFVLGELERTRGWAKAARVVPRGLRELGYRALAKSRYALFGRSETCLVPDARMRAKLVEDTDA